MENKSNKGLVVFLVLIILVLLGGLGFGAYKYLSLEKDYDKLSSENKSTNEESNNSVTQNDYSLFVKKMKEERTKLSKTNSDGSKIIISFNEEHNASDNSAEKEYSIKLTSDGLLLVDETEIAKNVLFYKTANIGNGGFRGLYYVTEEGKVYLADVELALYNKKEIETQEVKNITNVVNILPAIAEEQSGKFAVSNPTIYFVDINGNILQSNS